MNKFTRLQAFEVSNFLGWLASFGQSCLNNEIHVHFQKSLNRLSDPKESQNINYIIVKYGRTFLLPRHDTSASCCCEDHILSQETFLSGSSYSDRNDPWEQWMHSQTWKQLKSFYIPTFQRWGHCKRLRPAHRLLGGILPNVTFGRGQNVTVNASVSHAIASLGGI